ncbi:MAG TPA: hypothetical protein PLD10_13170 [Rhodopila sp.]|nr:hypothetical protein [Rhodopila sp.]
MKIWCLFSIENDYNQPEHNLVGWWLNKPSLETVGAAIGINFPFDSDDDVVNVVRVWQGTPIMFRDATYTLEEIEEGVVKMEQPKIKPKRAR